ncbi:MAG TPA: hypothetical protein VK968_02930 [Roseimicrobium sp.]|nr:hypothetical protein [Roseimicrobium sp.]
MILATQIKDPDGLVGTLALVLLLSVGLVRLFRWHTDRPASPDPWNDEVAAGMDAEDAKALCHQCLEAHDSSHDFCKDCGAPVGQYTNWLPFPFYFSIGHILRLGASGGYKETPFTVCGFILLGLAEYGWFAPVYWWRLLNNIPTDRSSEPSSDSKTSETVPENLTGS